ncbi:MAG: TIGR04282 family arsenosugar biosynthesis glycosyltransferase [Pseudomonadota bacterium]
MTDTEQNGKPVNCLVLQFAREPVAGQVKTRMLPQLTPEEASDLHCELVLFTAQRLLNAAVGPVELEVAGDPLHPLFQRCRSLGVANCRAQRGDDLGARMHNALRQGLRRSSKVILVGSDCPEMDTGYLKQAVNALDEEEIVLGPASDGGYVLLGARRLIDEMFEKVKWGSDTVMASTRSQLRAAQTRWSELAPLSDIDRPDDLPLWDALKRTGPALRSLGN